MKDLREEMLKRVRKMTHCQATIQTCLECEADTDKILSLILEALPEEWNAELSPEEQELMMEVFGADKEPQFIQERAYGFNECLRQIKANLEGKK